MVIILLNTHNVLGHDQYIVCVLQRPLFTSGPILGLRPANERRRYNVTESALYMDVTLE